MQNLFKNRFIWSTACHTTGHANFPKVFNVNTQYNECLYLFVHIEPLDSSGALTPVSSTQPAVNTGPEAYKSFTQTHTQIWERACWDQQYLADDLRGFGCFCLPHLLHTHVDTHTIRYNTTSTALFAALVLWF